VKVHEGHGGMHKGCLKHKAPGAYPDCHWHEYVNGKYYVRRRPCSPKNLCDEN
jgi:hypothetical protein